MIIRFRPDGLTPYRLLFTIIFIALGMAGGSVFFMGDVIWLSAAFAPNGSNQEAFMWAAGIGGIVSLLYGMLLLYMMTERRAGQQDRRRQTIDIGFSERRTGTDRRERQQEQPTHNTALPQHPHAA